MTLVEALKKYGKVRKESWTNKEFYFTLNALGKLKSSNPHHVGVSLYLDSLEATDWCEYSEKGIYKPISISLTKDPGVPSNISVLYTEINDAIPTDNKKDDITEFFNKVDGKKIRQENWNEEEYFIPNAMTSRDSSLELKGKHYGGFNTANTYSYDIKEHINMWSLVKEPVKTISIEGKVDTLGATLTQNSIDKLKNTKWVGLDENLTMIHGKPDPSNTPTLTKEQIFFDEVKGKKIRLNTWCESDYFIPRRIKPDNTVEGEFVTNTSNYTTWMDCSNGFEPDNDEEKWEFVDKLSRLSNTLYNKELDTQKKCSCDMRALMMNGCKCGGV